MTDGHDAIRDFLDRTAKGKGGQGKKMVLNPQTGKFELVSADKVSAGDVAEITVEDMRSFRGGLG
ncbi:hypothetical protein [Actinokineospora sp. NBRC 105648]|uniref:hypothetical protein n=1 Tax=Actinokineospora sp. NBRC 105648 TaxID=3032206 RepID=UPI0024A2AB51|nr:hypothetical protein [Actinokineospora sp. NBRC 105648]GLZ40785.1 hypothetical protein Acsp05_44090 [Actinokineospora sp. NBRC 105648]